MNQIKILQIIMIITLLVILSQCCASNEQVESEQQSLIRKNYPSPSLSRGMAEVTATFLEFSNENQKMVGLFRIDSVHGYGPAIPPIGVGSKLNIEFSKNLLQEKKNVTEQIMKKGTKYRLLVLSIRSGKNIDDTKLWQIISIK